jgi:hypothetical protein
MQHLPRELDTLLRHGRPLIGGTLWQLLDDNMDTRNGDGTTDREEEGGGAKADREEDEGRAHGEGVGR